MTVSLPLTGDNSVDITIRRLHFTLYTLLYRIKPMLTTITDGVGKFDWN